MYDSSTYSCMYKKHACMHTLYIRLRYITLRYITCETRHPEPAQQILGVFGASGYSCSSGRVIKSIFQNWRGEHLPKNAELGDTGSISIRKLPFFQHPNDHPKTLFKMGIASCMRIFKRRCWEFSWGGTFWCNNILEVLNISMEGWMNFPKLFKYLPSYL